MAGFKYGCWGRPDPVSPSCAKLVDSVESVLEELLPALGESLKAKVENVEPKVKLDNDEEKKDFFIIILGRQAYR